MSKKPEEHKSGKAGIPPGGGWRMGVDVGGTFTDIALSAGERIHTAKALTTPERPVEGVLEGIGYALDAAGLDSAAFRSVIHGTTLATNALIERRGAKVGVITTDGFRDILEIGYERRYDQYDINIGQPDRIVPRDRMFGVRERINASGEVIEALDEASLALAIGRLLDDGVESVAVCLLHSYQNPIHEQRVRERLGELAPGLPVSLSAEVSPEVREFDRLCTTVCNAYIKPLMASYLGELETALAGRGFECPLFVITSGGGITTPETAMRFPIRLVESGPSGGAILAARVAAQRDIADVLSFDMGGTTAKVCLIEDARPRSSRSFEIDRADRYLKGSGIPARIPVIEMIEIGAGGGSIATVDPLGRLRVGPNSASSVPGPACYGRGGVAPTVTDSDLVAGYLDPADFAEGRLELRPELARAAIAGAIAGPLDTTVTAGADGISKTVDEAMANAARIHAVEQGKNLGQCTMIAFGGNGALHATRVAEKLGIGEIIVPPSPGVGSAVGFLHAPVAYEIVRSRHVRVDSFPFDEINRLLQDLEQEARAVVAAGAPGERLEVRRIAFMRYAGQGHEIEVGIPDGDISEHSLPTLAGRFESEYARLFVRAVPSMWIEIMNWSVTVSNRVPPAHVIVDGGESRQVAATDHRALCIGTTGEHIRAGIFERGRLRPGDAIGGPALIVEPQTTTFVSAAFTARVDAAGNIVMTRRESRPGSTAGAIPRHSTIDLQVMWDRLMAVVEEQSQVLMRTAFSPIVRECGDISAGIFDLQGRMLAQAVTGTPGHVNTMAASVSKMLPYFPMDTMRPGDVYMTNDPWIGSGHLNDVVMFAPIFHRDKPVAFTACTSHLYDLGGLGMGPDGSDVFEEGLSLPPMKLVDNGEVNLLVMDIMKANSRSPVANEGDLYALIACCDVAAARLDEMLGELGADDIEPLAAHILDASRRATEAAIALIPDGDYENELMTDGYDFEIKLKARMTVSGNRIVTDFSGTSGHSARGINVPIKYTEAYAVFALRCLIGAGIPNNAGSLGPFRFEAPRDCILNAQFPAPVAMRHCIGQMVADLMLGCLHGAMPGTAPAEGATCLYDLPLRSIAAIQPGGGNSAFATELCHSGGMGARPALDGLSATAYPSGLWGTPVEIAESTAPLYIRRRELIRDSGGPGRFRGGLGQMIELESSEGAPILLLAGVERTKYPARGRDGGHEGAPGRITLRSGPTLNGKGEQLIPAGDLLYWEAPGGGGYGEPSERDPLAVARDVQLGLVSPQAATEIYGVVFAGNGSLDEAATAERRRQIVRGAA
ncbi:MAG: hydantoinase B/oxoprolinase family protein [Gammaproteobacteria bacterium]|nr:hydantoinase B/oxoprolinase family protein [Gammaproteobacteria bacterium]